MRIPGLRGAGAWGRALASEVETRCCQRILSKDRQSLIPMPFASLAADVALASGLVGGLDAASFVMVDVDEERLKVLASGARCVSLSSTAQLAYN